MAKYRLSGLLLLCLGWCLAKDADMKFRCPGKGEDLGEKSGHCKLREEFDDKNYYCVQIESVRCADGIYVAHGSVCTYRKGEEGKMEEVFTCKSGEWIQHDKPTSKDRKRRGWWWGRRTKIVYKTVYKTNKPPVISGCPTGGIQVTAPKGKTTAVASWKAPTASDPERKAVTVELVTSKSPGAVFEPGETTVVYRARDSGGAADYCWFKVDVDVLRCSQKPRHIQHGTYSCSHPNDENLYGSVCTYRCNSGYEISGPSAILECQQNQQWNFPVPSCEPISCGSPDPVQAATLDCLHGHVFPELCYSVCKNGYAREGGPPFIRCTENKSWTSTQDCIDSKAPVLSNCPSNMNFLSGPLEAPVPINWTDPVVTDSSNYTLTSTMEKGSLMGPGIAINRITATDTVGNSKSCNFVVVVQAKTCKEPQRPANSFLNCTHRYLEGSQCTVICDPGYVLQGSATLTCEDEAWNHASPVCKAVVCGNPPVVEFGTFSGGSFHYPAVLTLTCKPTFDLQGDPFLRCQENGTWSHLGGKCVDISPPTFPSGCPEVAEKYASRLGQSTVVHWTPPAVEDNSKKSITLLSNVVPGSVFLPGVTSVTYTAVDYRDNNSSCTFYVLVKTLTCPSLKQNYTSDNYLRFTCPDKNVYGAVCTSYCTNGFPKRGADNLTCELDSSSAYPPTVSWQWDQSSSPPECIESNCGNLTAPRNGAVACYYGNLARECVMSCAATHDVPAKFDGSLKCPYNKGIWYPSSAPDCTKTYLPGKTRMMADVYYYTDSCPESLDEIKQNFVIAIQSIYPDPCTNLPEICVEDNIKVTCGAVRRKKSTLDSMEHCLKNNQGNIWLCHLKRRRSVPMSSFIRVTASLKLNCDDGVISREKAFQNCTTKADEVRTTLENEADGGQLNLGTKYNTSSQLVSAEFQVDCDPGTVYIPRIQTTRLSCVGCSKGNFAIGSTQCEECPVGTYTELDNATACTPCPPGWSTPTTGSTSISDCQEMCKPGHYSEDGFIPCQPCPPGQFQADSRAVSCNLCPASTWTRGAAYDLQHCVSADAHLNNTSLIAQSSKSLSALTLVSYLFLADVAASNVTFTFAESSYHPTSVHLYTDSNLASYVPPLNSSVSVSLHTEPNAWLRLVLTADPSSGRINIMLGNSSVFTGSITSTTSLPPTDVTVTATKGKVLVSGLFGKEGLDNMDIPSTNCNGNSSTNLLTWELPFISLQLPSICDAVDECQSSPCSNHGACINQQGGYKCQCLDGWSGPTCHLPPDACYQHQCQNGATCLSQGSSYSCVCTEIFSGTHCELIKVNGGFSDWSEWSNCSSPCDGKQYRQRHCNNPEPLNNGNNCTGDFEQIQSCGSTSCPVDGQWSAWTQWSACSASCGVGAVRTRQRYCNNPVPQFDGNQCVGPSSEVDDCPIYDCAVDGNWSPWSQWTPCSKSCGGGMQSHERTCSNPAPQFGGMLCTGVSKEMRTCNTDILCPVCSRLQKPRSVVLDCDNEGDPPPDPVTCNVTCAPGYETAESFPQYKCGQSTGYLWNDQINSGSPVFLPACSVPKTSQAVKLDSTLHVKTPCTKGDNINMKKIKQLPCELEGCRISTSAVCSEGSQTASSRKKRSTGTLILNIRMNMEFGSSNDINESDASTVQYINQLTVADQSARALTSNETSSLFTISVNGNAIQPDQTSVVYDVSMQCPSGTISSSYYCVDCPKGTMEENGQCVMCPVGQYQDQPGSTSCKSCPDGFSWDLPGATDIAQCVFPVKVTPAPKENISEDELEGENQEDLALIVGVSVAVFVLILLAGFVFAVIYVKPKLMPKMNMYRRRSSVFPLTENSRRTSIFDTWVQEPLEKHIPPVETSVP